MAEITREAFSKAMHEAVEERGRDFIYPEEWLGDEGCQYATEDGEPACIVGLALHKLGVDVAGLPNESAAVMLPTELHIVDNVLIRAARSAQVEQDRLRTWGEALDAFDEWVGARA